MVQKCKGSDNYRTFPGNASLIKLTLSNNNIETFAWGLRNINGMNVNSEGKIFAVVGGMEDRGLRPVKGDYDYIYEIQEGKWYGWPDYSGGPHKLTKVFFRWKEQTGFFTGESAYCQSTSSFLSA